MGLELHFSFFLPFLKEMQQKKQLQPSRSLTSMVQKADEKCVTVRGVAILEGWLCESRIKHEDLCKYSSTVRV